MKIVKEMSSDESDDGAVEVDVYRRKYQLIIERCEIIQQDNERLVNRIQQIKRIINRRRKERKFLMARLDQYSDNWRNIPLPLEPDNYIAAQKARLAKKVNAAEAAASAEKPKKGKRRGAKTDKNAPKRPANPYFQFCQEQRTTAIEEMASSGQTEPSKVEVTKHLANKWNMLTSDDKKIYYDMYEKSKERYNADMKIYTKNKEQAEKS